jgi:DNA-binding NarL/FixJ family response regulator
MIRVLLADDFPLMREALVASLACHPEIEVVATAEDGVAALERASALRPDVVVLDLCMPRMGGLAALRVLTAELPGVRVLVLSAVEEAEPVVDALRVGADGFLSKSATGAQLAAAIVAVHRGEPVVSASLTPHLVRALRRQVRVRHDCGAALSADEVDVLRLVAAGRTDRQISEALFVSPRTVQSHLTRIRGKLGLRRRAHLASWATENRLD